MPKSPHTCPVRGCGRTYDRASRLLQHADRHMAQGNFVPNVQAPRSAERSKHRRSSKNKGRSSAEARSGRANEANAKRIRDTRNSIHQLRIPFRQGEVIDLCSPAPSVDTDTDDEIYSAVQQKSGDTQTEQRIAGSRGRRSESSSGTSSVVTARHLSVDGRLDRQIYRDLIEESENRIDRMEGHSEAEVVRDGTALKNELERGGYRLPPDHDLIEARINRPSKRLVTPANPTTPQMQTQVRKTPTWATTTPPPRMSQDQPSPTRPTPFPMSARHASPQIGDANPVTTSEIGVGSQKKPRSESEKSNRIRFADLLSETDESSTEDQLSESGSEDDESSDIASSDVSDTSSDSSSSFDQSTDDEQAGYEHATASKHTTDIGINNELHGRIAPSKTSANGQRDIPVADQPISSPSLFQNSAADILIQSSTNIGNQRRLSHEPGSGVNCRHDKTGPETPTHSNSNVSHLLTSQTISSPSPRATQPQQVFRNEQCTITCNLDRMLSEPTSHDADVRSGLLNLLSHFRCPATRPKSDTDQEYKLGEKPINFMRRQSQALGEILKTGEGLDKNDMARVKRIVTSLNQAVEHL